MVQPGQTSPRINKFIARLGGLTSSGHKDALGGVSQFIRGTDRALFNKTEHSLGNIFGRKPKPWFLGSLAFMALIGGSEMGEQLYQSTISEQQDTADGGILGNTVPEWTSAPRGGQAPVLTYDGMHNPPDDLNTMGLVQALHKNRHG